MVVCGGGTNKPAPELKADILCCNSRCICEPCVDMSDRACISAHQACLAVLCHAVLSSHYALIRLRKAVEYWKEQAGLITADAKVAADLYEIENRRCDSPAPSTDAALAGLYTPPGAAAAAAGGGSTTSSVQGSRPGTGLSRTVGSAIALQLQAAAADASAPMAEPGSAAAAAAGAGAVAAAAEGGSIAGGEQPPPHSSGSSGAGSEREL